MPRIRILDGLRGLAIIMVLLGHSAANYQPLANGTRGWLSSFANAGMGVRLFFALSGYLITELLLREQEQKGVISLGAFYLRRAKRILPAFYVFLSVLAVCLALNPPTLPTVLWFASASFTWNYVLNWYNPAGINIWNLGHTWSLAVEAQFYLLWPAILIWLKPARALKLVCLLLVLSPFIRLGSYVLFPSQRGLLGMMLHTGADGLLAGCLVALLARMDWFMGFIRQHGTWGTALALTWIFLLGPLVLHQVRGFSIAGGFTLDALAAAWIVVRFHLDPPNWAQRFFGKGILPSLGLISYSLYLWQQYFLRPDGELSQGRIMMPVAAAVAVACISYYCVERPFCKLRSPRGG